MTLAVGRDASDGEIRAAYRRLVQLHHPDHNGGSAESTRRFEEVQDAYSEIMRLRRLGSDAPRTASAPPPPAHDPEVESRLADLERQVREAHAARERARRAAAQAAARTERRASDEELGYIRTDDSFSKLLSDARDELAGWLGDGLTPGRRNAAAQHVGDLIDELGAKLRGERRRGSGSD